MALRVPFRQLTPEGLSIQVVEYEGYRILLLVKDVLGQPGKATQVMGIATETVPGSRTDWFYEFEPLPPSLSKKAMAAWLQERGYVLGLFDQYGNFERAA